MVSIVKPILIKISWPALVSKTYIPSNFRTTQRDASKDTGPGETGNHQIPIKFRYGRDKK